METINIFLVVAASVSTILALCFGIAYGIEKEKGDYWDVYKEMCRRHNNLLKALREAKIELEIQEEEDFPKFIIKKK